MALPKTLSKSQSKNVKDETIVDPDLAISNKSVIALLNHMQLDYKKKKQEYKEKYQTFKMNEFGNVEQDEQMPIAPKSKVNISFVVNIQSAASLKSPVPNIPLSRYHRIPMVIKLPNRISKLGQDKILFIVKDPGDVYTEKLSACDQYLDEKLKVKKESLGNTEIKGWRDRLNEKKGKSSKPGMKRSSPDDKIIDMNKNSSTRLTETSTELFSRIYGVKQLKQLKNTKQLAKTLSSFDVILLDHRVGDELRKKILTTTVIRHRKQPYTIKLYDPSKDNLEKKMIDSKRQKLGKGFKIEKAEIDYIDPEFVFNQVNSIVRNTSVVIPWIATSLNKYDKEQRTSNTISLDIVCYRLDLENKNIDINEASVIILENCKAILQYLIKNLIKDKKYVISSVIKTGESQSLPMDSVDSILRSYY
ncbi:hypothetical protein FOG51_01415 [Hanseniaspora uvarum]|nr:hypothetical protein FOG51_01415 [Hanseniaspora uvarum]KAF0278740.1 hypothetical protein FOG50_00406 [Hanseniaspora uvarum]GMM42560.1 hypothetical protein DAHU10_034700 [Hanseniaspora uvarum]